MEEGQKKHFQELALIHGTPLMIIDHEKIRQNYLEFKENFPRIQAYYAVKANPESEIVKTLYDLGASFDVASFPEFQIVYEHIKHLPAKEQQDFIWDKIIYANTIKQKETLQKLNPYKPLVTFDNISELNKIKEYCPNAGVVLRIMVPNTGSMVELSSKFGANPSEAVDLIHEAFNLGLVVEGLSFHVGSQCTNFNNYMHALQIASNIFHESEIRGHKLKILDIGGGFPVKYTEDVKHLKALSVKLNSELERLFPKDIEILAEP